MDGGMVSSPIFDRIRSPSPIRLPPNKIQRMVHIRSQLKPWFLRILKIDQFIVKADRALDQASGFVFDYVELLTSEKMDHDLFLRQLFCFLRDLQFYDECTLLQDDTIHETEWTDFEEYMTWFIHKLFDETY